MFGNATNKLLKSSGAVFVFRLLGMVLSYLAIMFIGNSYGAAAYGRFSILQTVLQFSVVVFSFGMDTLIVKLTADIGFFEDNKPINNYLLKAFTFVLISGIVGTIFFYFLKNVWAEFIFKDIELVAYFTYLAYFFLGVILHNFFSEFLRGTHQFVKYGLVKFFLPPFLFLVTMYYFESNSWEESSIFLAYVLGFSVLLIPLIFSVPFNKLVTPQKYPYNKMLNISFPMMFSAAFLFLSNWTDIFMLGAMVEKADVGIYNTAYKLAIIALLAIHAINTIIAPRISLLFSQRNLKGIKEEVQRATKIITYITLPIVFVLIVFGKFLLSFFGPEFVTGYPALVIISVGLLFNAMSGSVGQVLNMTKHQKALRKFTIISVFINIVLNYWGIKQMGYIGAAYASVISNITLNVLCLLFIQKHLKFNAFFKPWK